MDGKLKEDEKQQLHHHLHHHPNTHTQKTHYKDETRSKCAEDIAHRRLARLLGSQRFFYEWQFPSRVSARAVINGCFAAPVWPRPTVAGKALFFYPS